MNKKDYRLGKISEAEFFSMRDQWNGLLQNSSADNIFLTWEWLSTWWKHFKGKRDLFVLCAYDAEEKVVGLAPLYIEKVFWDKLIPVKKLSFLGSDGVGSDFLDFILGWDDEDDIAECIFGGLKSMENRWDVIHLSDISERSATFARVSKFFDSESYNVFTKRVSVCPYINLPDVFESYVDSLSRNMKYNIRRRTQNFFRDPDAKFTEWNSDVCDKDAMNLMFDLHNKRFAEMDRTSSFGGGKVESFHRDVFELFRGGNLATVYMLLIKECPVACLYAFHYGKRFYYYQSGMDPHFESMSPGLVLMGLCVKEAVSRKFDEFHYLRGNESYKWNWTKTALETKDITIIRNKIKGKLLNLLISGKEISKDIIKRYVLDHRSSDDSQVKGNNIWHEVIKKGEGGLSKEPWKPGG